MNITRSVKRTLLGKVPPPYVTDEAGNTVPFKSQDAEFVPDKNAFVDPGGNIILDLSTTKSGAPAAAATGFSPLALAAGAVALYFAFK